MFLTPWDNDNFDMPRTYTVPRTYLSKIHKAHTLFTWQAQHTPHHDTTDPLEISVRNMSHQRRMNEVVNPLLDHDSRWRVPFFLHCPSKSSRQADMAKRMARDRMRWDRMCTASRQQRSLLALATAPGCSPGPSIGGVGVALCDWAAAGHQVMAALTVPRDPAGVAKRMAHERRESLQSWWVDPLWYFAIMGVWWVDLLCMIGSQWFWTFGGGNLFFV